MFLFKRAGIYYLEYLDSKTKSKKRISTKVKTKPEAIKFVSEFKEKLKYKVVVKKISLKEFEEKYFNYTEINYTQKYLKSIKVSFNMFREFIDNPNLDNISVNDVERFLVMTFRRSKSAAHLYQRTLKASFNKGVVWGYLEANPFAKVKLPKQIKSLPSFISKEEFQKIILLTENEKLKEIFTAAYYTGMRQSELLHLKWTSINFERKQIIVRNTDEFVTKSKKERSIPMNSIIYFLLSNKYKSHRSEYVFPNDRNYKFNEDYISHKFKKIIRKAKLSESYKFHTLRHSFASNLVQKGVSLYIVKELLGHQDISTTQIYAHLDNLSLCKAIELL
ncbi:MAG: site-specific integrase [Ignavibacteriae bacterium]|nr:site-specific integrase [Ignavibacteriota bacterium]